MCHMSRVMCHVAMCHFYLLLFWWSLVVEEGLVSTRLTQSRLKNIVCNRSVAFEPMMLWFYKWKLHKESLDAIYIRLPWCLLFQTSGTGPHPSPAPLGTLLSACKLWYLEIYRFLKTYMNFIYLGPSIQNTNTTTMPLLSWKKIEALLTVFSVLTGLFKNLSCMQNT